MKLDSVGGVQIARPAYGIAKFAVRNSCRTNKQSLKEHWLHRRIRCTVLVDSETQRMADPYKAESFINEGVEGHLI